MAYRNEGGYRRFIDEDGYPCQQPPWGELSAVNANTGNIAWRVPLGSYDELEAQGLKNAGAANMGGSIVTAGILQALRFQLVIAAEGSEEHTSELQSRPHLVCRLLLFNKIQLRSTSD